MTLLARKTDFTEIVQMSVNIPDTQVTVATTDTERYHVVPMLPPAMVTAMKEIVSGDPATWDVSEAYTAGKYVIHPYQQEYYVFVCITANSASEPTPVNGAWKVSELGTLWYNHVRRWVVYRAYSDMLVTHGNNFTQFGLVRPQETESTAVSGTDRGGMINLYKGRASSEQGISLRIFSEKHGTFDGVAYSNTGTSKPKYTFGITPI